MKSAKDCARSVAIPLSLLAAKYEQYSATNDCTLSMSDPGYPCNTGKSATGKHPPA